ncbi:DUF262 domain-containing protein [Rhodoplanes sp. SY1]|uniref:DUF262 domain-containing protein n=1 Tax=Rhodoplanes sp. SY1 TaxID=3166646 RepID=UPI0038B4D445
MSEDPITFMDNEEESDVQLVEYDITSSANDFNVLTITSYIETGSIILPPYQRNYTWDKKRASKLIESLILGLPVPQIFLYEEARNRFAILDGQQRLMSVYFFRKKRFPKVNKRAELREVFVERGRFSDALLSDDRYFEPFNITLPALGGEERSPLHGLNYDTLGEYQSSFNLRPIRCVIIKQNEPKDDNSSVYEIFDRLNTGGVNLKPQEIRANLYFSDFYEALYELNKDPRWRKIFGKDERDKELRDVELLLRAFAMLVYSNEYKPSMTRFLNRFSNYAKKSLSKKDIDYLKSLFDRFLTAVDGVSPAVFRATGRFSIGVFESVFVGRCTQFWAQRDQAIIPPIPEAKIVELSTAVRALLQEGTTKPEYVKDRLAKARELMR